MLWISISVFVAAIVAVAAGNALRFSATLTGVLGIVMIGVAILVVCAGQDR
jgi:hypothetical protein